MRVAVIGVGAMGEWLARFAKQNLGEVVVADKNASKASRVAKELGVQALESGEAAARADVVLVAVPISRTPQLIKLLAPRMRTGALLADVASAKSEVVKAMREVRARVELVSIHPLFGPGASGIKGKDVIAVPVRPGKLYSNLKKRLIELGARVVEMEAEEHDRLMAVCQGLSHFVLLSYLSSLKRVKEFKLVKDLRIPFFSSLNELAKALLAGNPQLFGEIQVKNQYAKLVRSIMLETCRSLDVAFSARNAKTVEKIFKEISELWGSTEANAAYKRLYKHFEEGLG